MGDTELAESLKDYDVVTYCLVPFRDKTKATKIAHAGPKVYADIVRRTQGRAISVEAAKVELLRVRTLPMPKVKDGEQVPGGAAIDLGRFGSFLAETNSFGRSSTRVGATSSKQRQPASKRSGL